MHKRSLLKILTKTFIRDSCFLSSKHSRTSKQNVVKYIYNNDCPQVISRSNTFFFSKIPTLINFKDTSDATKAVCKYTVLQTSCNSLWMKFHCIGFRSNHRKLTKMISPIHLSYFYWANFLKIVILQQFSFLRHSLGQIILKLGEHLFIDRSLNNQITE